jgi:glycosyltransferase involved in cell wall biosynthesis
MECLATGTPIICSDKSGAKEQIEESKGGVVIAGDLTTHKLVEAQANLRVNFEIYSENANAAIVGQFSVENWGRKLVSYLEEAVKLTS